jgi:hypothetical protein
MANRPEEKCGTEAQLDHEVREGQEVKNLNVIISQPVMSFVRCFENPNFQ